MIDHLHRILTTAAHQVASFLVRLATALTVPAPQPVLARAAARHRRGATFVEYALLAAIAVGVFVLINGVFGGIFTRLLDNIRDAVLG